MSVTVVLFMLFFNVVLMMSIFSAVFLFFFFKQKTAYEIGTGDWSSDVCSSDLIKHQQIRNNLLAKLNASLSGGGMVGGDAVTLK